MRLNPIQALEIINGFVENKTERYKECYTLVLKSLLKETIVKRRTALSIGVFARAKECFIYSGRKYRGKKVYYHCNNQGKIYNLDLYVQNKDPNDTHHSYMSLLRREKRGKK